MPEISIDAVKLCGGCHYAYFCSKECQMQAWNADHREECEEAVAYRRRNCFSIAHNICETYSLIS